MELVGHPTWNDSAIRNRDREWLLTQTCPLFIIFFRNKEIQCFCLKTIKLNDIIQVKIKVVFGTTLSLASYQMYMKLWPLNLTIAKHNYTCKFVFSFLLDKTNSASSILQDKLPSQDVDQGACRSEQMMIDSAVVTSTTSSAKTIIQENLNQVPRNVRRDNIAGARGTCIQGKKKKS